MSAEEVHVDEQRVEGVEMTPLLEEAWQYPPQLRVAMEKRLPKGTEEGDVG